MKYLRNFDTLEEEISFVTSFDRSYGILFSCNEIPGRIGVIDGGSSSTFIVSWRQESWLNVNGTCNGEPFSSGDSLPAGSTIVLTCAPYGVDPQWHNIPEDAIISGDGWVATFTLNSNVIDAYCNYAVN